MKKSQATMGCPTFQKQESIIRDMTDRINRAEGMSEKAGIAEEMQKEVAVLLSCLEYDEEKVDCGNCRFIANLREKTARLLIRTRKLG
ncbi:MAG: hypothetical protein Q7J27_13965 [Syntrophales bacterium]|nr:hypothetical protein [Syntrophales bacterium]